VQCAIILFNMEQAPLEPTSIQTKRTSKLAITSLIFGILSLLNFVLFPSGGIIHPIFDTILFAVPGITAFVLGIISIIKVGKPSNLKGIGFGIAGLILAIPTLLFVIGNFIMMALH